MKNLSPGQVLKVLADATRENPTQEVRIKFPIECGALIARSVKCSIQTLEYRAGIKELTIMDRGGLFVKDFMIIIVGSCYAVESVVKDIISFIEA